MGLERESWSEVACGQGDQIGRIFAYWAIAFFGRFFEIYSSSANSWPIYIFHKIGYAFCNFDKNVLGYSLGDF
jgi:hypothetical protein